MPDDVPSAMENVDAALSRSDVEAAMAAISRLNGPLVKWLEKLARIRHHSLERNQQAVGRFEVARSEGALFGAPSENASKMPTDRWLQPRKW